MDANSTSIIMDANSVSASMDATTLYYTFSTIAQTLAAAFAFVGAFVLFRLQNIEHQIETYSEELLNRYSVDYDPEYVRQVAIKRFDAKQWTNLIEGVQNNYIDIMINKSINRARSRAERDGIEFTKENKERIEKVTRKKAEEELLKGYPYPLCALIVTCLNEKEQLLKGFKRAASLIVISIILSVVFLPFCKILVRIPRIWPVLILILIIALTAISIILSILLIFRTLSLKFTKDDKLAK